jgi:hypothetical protein
MYHLFPIYFALTYFLIVLDPRHLRYGVRERPHEAGYDAFLTAQVFLPLVLEMDNKWLSDVVRDMFPETQDQEFTEPTLRRVVEKDFMPDSFEVLKGDEFREWKGMFMVGGTIEGCVKLAS